MLIRLDLPTLERPITASGASSRRLSSKATAGRQPAAQERAAGHWAPGTVLRSGGARRGPHCRRRLPHAAAGRRLRGGMPRLRARCSRLATGKLALLHTCC
jgi:hypothetical protein